MQRGGRQGDWEVFGEGLHRWQGEAETAKAGGILLQFCTLAKINLIYVYFLGIKDESVISSTYSSQNLLLGWGGLCTGRSRHWPREGLHLVRNDFLRWRSGGRPLQMVVSHEVLKVKVHRCQRPLHSSRPGSKIQVLVLPDALNFPSAHSAF